MALIIRHFDNPYSAQDALEALTDAGIPEKHIGLLTRAGTRGHFEAPPGIDPEDVSPGEGTVLGTLAGLVTGIVALATPLGPLLAAGPLFGALVGALAGGATGGIIASLVDFGVDERVAARLADALEDEDALLLSVRVADGQEAATRALLAQSEQLHEDELRFFQRYHAEHAAVPYERFHDAYHFGYRAAARQPRPFDQAAPYLRNSYPGDFDGDLDALRVGYQRYLDTIQVVQGIEPEA